jgi:predicted small lipoprotein YifL
MMVSHFAHPVLLRILVSAMLLSFAAGCGVAGPPIAPENIGIEAKIRAQRQAEEPRATPEAPSPEEEPEVVLPPLRPVGTQ